MDVPKKKKKLPFRAGVQHGANLAATTTHLAGIIDTLARACGILALKPCRQIEYIFLFYQRIAILSSRTSRDPYLFLGFTR